MSASCCGASHKTAALVVMAVVLCVLIPTVVVLGLKASRETVTHEPAPREPVPALREPPPAPTPATVEVIVAAAELPAGTVFRPDNVEQLTVVKAVPVAALPQGITLVTSRAELTDKRLERTAHRGEWLVVGDINPKPQPMFPPGSEIMSIPMPTKTAVAEEVRPGSRVDLVASYSEGAERRVFTLLPDMDVLAVGGVQNLPCHLDTQDLTMLSFAVNQKQALLVALANQRNCNLELVPRQPGTSRSAWDYDATLARLKGLQKEVRDAEVEVAPFPRAVP